jgi:prepilin-type N-terminal cleavage/methylation domain-containing protein
MRRAGFTLIELLAVLVILSILIVFLVTRLGKAGDVAKERLCRARLALISAAIDEYEHELGHYPPSRFQEAWGQPPNAINLGAEALVLALWSPDWGGVTLSEDELVNTDEDRAKHPLAKFATPDLLELGDPWKNPIAYLERADYARQDVYATIDPQTGESLESTVTARVNQVTGRPFEPTKYQLISAGPDGEFGTDDDICNFKTR